MITATVILKVLIVLLMIRLLCSFYIIFTAISAYKSLNSFDYLLIFTIAPELLILCLMCKLFGIKE